MFFEHPSFQIILKSFYVYSMHKTVITCKIKLWIELTVFLLLLYQPSNLLLWNGKVFLQLFGFFYSQGWEMITAKFSHFPILRNVIRWMVFHWPCVKQIPMCGWYRNDRAEALIFLLFLRRNPGKVHRVGAMEGFLWGSLTIASDVADRWIGNESQSV